MYCLELGGSDDPFAAAEAEGATRGADVSIVAAGLATTRSLDQARVRTLAYTHRVSRIVAKSDPTIDDASIALDIANLGIPDESPDGTPTTVAVRARDVRKTTGVDTQQAERALGRELGERDFDIDLEDPDYELRANFSDDICILGWLVAESVRDFGDRKPTDRPFFQPGSMDPLLARALVNLARVDPGDRLLDPMCGTGGVLIEAGLVGANPVGSDAQEKMVRGARENLQHFFGDRSGSQSTTDCDPAATDFHIARADATNLPLRDESVDAVVFDAPYGRQSKIETHRLDDLVGGALGEARRLAPRAVMVADRDWRDAVTEAGWTVEHRFVRRVHRSLDRHVLVLD